MGQGDDYIPNDGDPDGDADFGGGFDAGADAMLAELTAVLEPLWRIVTARPGQPCSLARLGKQARFAMSTLRRQLTVLTDAGLVTVAMREDGSGDVALTAAGAELCASLFTPEAPSTPP